jgi:hypothetical protein
VKVILDGRWCKPRTRVADGNRKHVGVPCWWVVVVELEEGVYACGSESREGKSSGSEGSSVTREGAFVDAIVAGICATLGIDEIGSDRWPSSCEAPKDALIPRMSVSSSRSRSRSR